MGENNPEQALRPFEKAKEIKAPAILESDSVAVGNTASPEKQEQPSIEFIRKEETILYFLNKKFGKDSFESDQIGIANLKKEGVSISKLDLRKCMSELCRKGKLGILNPKKERHEKTKFIITQKPVG